MSPKSELNLKKQIIELLEIADINFLMSIKKVSPNIVLIKINENTNSIAQILGHCVRQMDSYLSRFSGKLKIIPKSVKIHELLEGGYPIGKFVDTYLKIFDEFVGYIKKVPDDQLNNPIKKGEKLVNIIQRISLHYMGHLGQISLIRKYLGDEIEGPYSFVKAMSKPTRIKLRKGWLEWWLENKKDYMK